MSHLGLPLFETEEALRIEQGDALEIHASIGTIKNLTKGETYRAQPIPPFAQEIMAACGLMKHVAKKTGLPGRPA